MFTRTHRRPALRRPLLSGLITGLGAMFSLHRQRARLAVLDDHALRDIGLSRAEAEREAGRPAWDAPKGWRD